jgi:DNA-binding NtrC family response regulator
VLCTGEQVTLEDLLLSEIDGSADTNLAGRSLRMGADARYELSLVEAKEEFEKSYLKFILEKTGGNIAEAARLAKQHRPNMYRLITKHGLDLNSFKKSGPSLDDVLESPRF